MISAIKLWTLRYFDFNKADIDRWKSLKAVNKAFQNSWENAWVSRLPGLEYRRQILDPPDIFPTS